MRTLRMSLAGAAVLALVGTSAVGVAAQPEQEIGTGPEFAWVASVIETNCWQDGSQTTWGDDGDGHSWFRGMKYGCDLEASDPRVSGTLRGTFGDDCFGETDDTCVFGNTEEITGPDGSWTGWVWGTHRPEQPGGQSLMTLLKVFTGHDAYEGLTLMLHGAGPLGGELDFHGLVYEGVPPPPLAELTFAMPSEASLAETEAIEAEPVEEPPTEAPATEDTAVGEPAEDHYLTGTMTFVEEIDPGTSTHPEGVLQTRGASAVYDLEMSDPRVSGTMTSRDVAVDGYGDLRVAFAGMTEVVNPDGSWTGDWSGVFEPSMGWQLLYKLEGQGGFEGLTFYLHGESPELDDGVWEMDGFVVGQPTAE